jgi:hypothetical protein
MKYFFAFAALLFTFNVTVPATAHAQFWKKNKKKEAKKSEDKKKKVTEPKVKAKKEPEYPATKLKDQYTIDIFLPLSLKEITTAKANNKKMADKYLPAINYYEGLALAADKLSAQNMKLQLNIHDITNPAHSVATLTSNKSLDSTDLLIGYVQSNDVTTLASFAKKNKINFVSTFSTVDGGVINNPYFIILQPSIATHMESAVAFVHDHFAKYPKYVWNTSKTSGEKEAANQLKKFYANHKAITFLDGLTIPTTKDTLSKLFDSTKTNVLFITALDFATSDKLISTLAQLPPAYTFEIIGMPSWKSFKTITQTDGKWSRFTIHLTSPFAFDSNAGSGKSMAEAYMEKHGTEAAEMTFRGYETLMWLAQMLEKYGTVFNPKLSDISTAPFTKFHFESDWNSSNDYKYTTNTKLYVYSYKNGNYTIAD